MKHPIPIGASLVSPALQWMMVRSQGKAINGRNEADRT
jgi:hypothetical protein